MPPCDHCNNRHENVPSSKSTVEASKDLGKVFKMNIKETVLSLTKNLKRQYKDVISDQLNKKPMAGKPMHVISDQLNEKPMAGKPMHIYLTEGPGTSIVRGLPTLLTVYKMGPTENSIL